MWRHNLLRTLTPVGLRFLMYGLILLPLGLGSLYTFVNSSRYNSPIFNIFKEIMPMKYYGLIFIVYAVVFVMAIWIIPDRTNITLHVGASYYLLWAVMFFAASFQTHGTFQGAFLFLFIAWTHFSAAQTFVHREAHYSQKGKRRGSPNR